MMRTSRKIARATLIATVAVASLSVASADAAPTGFVQRAGETLAVDGAPWRAIGVNLWDMDPTKVLAGDITGCWYQHADLDDYLDRSFAGIAANTHATAVRTFGFRAMYTDGGTDWSATDKLVHYARAHGLRLIPVFGDQYGTCGSPAKSPSWYRDGYRTLVEEPWGTTYRDYVIAAVRRYRDEPAIAFWQLMNEATAGNDRAALLSFSRDMVDAIRTEAGDPYHLVNLGTSGGSTVGNELPTYAQLLDCGAHGGCNDLAEAHVFNAAQPLPGLPLSSTVDAMVRVWNDQGETFTGTVTRPVIDGWSEVAITVGLPPSKVPYSNWELHLVAPHGSYAAYVDDVLISTTTTPTLYTFDAGNPGFTGVGAEVQPTTELARSGAGSLRASVGPATAASIVAPPIAGRPTAIELYVRLNFRAPAPETGASIAADLHAASVARAAPFVLGEIGYQAVVPGASCTGHRTRQERATLIDAMLTRALDPVYGADGGLVWDWKDPSIRSTVPDGRLVDDPTVDCWTLTPGDPAEAVLRAHADDMTPAPLPAPPALPSFEPYLTALRGPAGEIGFGRLHPITVRLTRGGDAMAGVRMVAAGGCAGEGMTDALGLAAFTCEAHVLGPATVTVAPDPATCGCTATPVTFPVVIKSAVDVTAAAEVGERGRPLGVRLAFEDPQGASLSGLHWSVPACALDGTITATGSTHVVEVTCPASADWQGTTALRVLVEGDDAHATITQDFVGLRFDRVFRDQRTNECIGLSRAAGWIGASARAGACTGGHHGSYDDWFAVQIPAGARASVFRQAAGYTAVDADLNEGRRIEGLFATEDASRSFAAVLVRADGAHALSATG